MASLRAEPPAAFGDTAVERLRTTGPDEDVDIAAGRVVRAVGYRGEPLAGLPLEQVVRMVAPNIQRYLTGDLG